MCCERGGYKASNCCHCRIYIYFNLLGIGMTFLFETKKKKKKHVTFAHVSRETKKKTSPRRLGRSLAGERWSDFASSLPHRPNMMKRAWAPPTRHSEFVFPTPLLIPPPARSASGSSAYRIVYPYHLSIIDPGIREGSVGGEEEMVHVSKQGCCSPRAFVKKKKTLSITTRH